MHTTSSTADTNLKTDKEGFDTGTDLKESVPPVSVDAPSAEPMPMPTEPMVMDPVEPGTDDMDHGSMDHGNHTPDPMPGMDTPSHGSDPSLGPDDRSGGHGGDHGSMPAVMPPGVGASAAQIADFIAALNALQDTHMHMDDAGMASEHMAVMDLVPRAEASHVAIGSGNWADPAIWAGGVVPGPGATVLIPEGVTVNYSSVSDASLFTLRVDGVLDFATDTSSQMVFDTMVVGTSGHLIIGTETDPVQANVSVDLIVANNGPIDTGWDPMLLSRGIVSHGQATIHGAAKDSHDKVLTDPMAGDMSLQFNGVPEGWQVGDTIVIAGTNYDGFKWDNDIRDVRAYDNEDEVRVITAISPDGTVTLNTALEHDHDTPRGDLKTSVANYSRSVTVETQNAETAEVWERGHVMFMHSDDIDVRYAAFDGLGRTDKSVDSMSLSSFDQSVFDNNVQGRYSLHLHRTGTEDLNNPAILEGNSVFGSPGWGIVHHDSNALLTNNATFDTFGAGFIAETGNETGAWVDNIAIFARGQSWDDPKNITNLNTFDTARGGDGFWFQGRMVASEDNVAASVNVGFVYFHRDGDARMIDFGAELFDYPDALYNAPGLTAHSTPILGFSGNEAFAAKEGLHVVKANPNQGHDVWSVLSDFTAWNVQNGAHLEYTSHYLLENFDLIGKEDAGFSPAREGISIGNNTTELTITNSQITNFATGIDFQKSLDENVGGTPEDHDYIVIDTVITNVDTPYGTYDPALDRIMSSSELPRSAPGLTLNTITMGVGIWGGTEISGTKTDSLGSVSFPGGTDVFQLEYAASVAYLEQNGYWETSAGQAYFLLDVYFTDRVTGEVFYETHPVFVPEGMANGFGASWSDYANASFNGVQNITSNGTMTMAGDVVLDQPNVAVPHGGFDLLRVDGSTSGQPIVGTNGNDALEGGAAGDLLNGGGGDDVLNGGEGIDTAMFSGDQANFTLELGPFMSMITDRSGANGNDLLLDLEFLDFDTDLLGGPFDLMTFGGLAGVLAVDLEGFIELYIAFFNRAPDALGLNFWGTAFANGTGMSDMSQLFVQQEETRTTYPEGQSNGDFALTVYANVLGRAPDPDGLSFWVGVLDDGSVGRDQFILEILGGAKAAPADGATPEFVAQQLADQAYLATKTDIGTHFAVTHGMSDVDNARAVMAVFDGTAASVNQAISMTDDFFAQANVGAGGEFLMPIVGVLDDPFA